MRKKRSIIWNMDKVGFAALVKSKKTIADIVRHFGFSVTGRAYKMVKERIEFDGIDAGHIPLGINSNSGRSFQREKIPLSEVMTEHSTYSRGHLKRRLIEDGILKNECAICGIGPLWNGLALVLVLDHVNGIPDDARSDNLRLLCPNCNSQQATFSERKNKQLRICNRCGMPKKSRNNQSLCCTKCSSFNSRKVADRPSLGVLTKMVESDGYRGTAKRYNVSDNTIRKWIKSYGQCPRRIDGSVHWPLKPETRGSNPPGGTT